ncbi:hypothetical protein F4677DRAFT_120025 [Hypoxylon crocopeplum]|nr:hypothetical protein F4677DRAFT_120025 [Hypoxylon crocopeplum]
MSASARAPKTIEELHVALRLRHRADAEELIKIDTVKEIFRKYSNRCLSSGSTKLQLPDWKDVDEYLLEVRTSWPVRKMGKTVEEIATQDCSNKPYDLLFHASLFALRIMTFFGSDEGHKYDIILEERRVKCPQDVQYDRCIRIMDLLGFLVNQDREMKREREAKKEQEMKEGNWI